MGSGFVYFIRSLLPNLGNEAISNLIFQCISIVLINTNPNYSKLYKGNLILFITTYSYFIINILYFFLYNTADGGIWINELILFGLSGAYLIQLMKVDNKIQDILPYAILILSLLINISLLYSILSNPYYIIGMRATVNFASNTSGKFSGNPHIYSKNGLIAVIVSLLLIFKNDKKFNILQYCFLWICLLLGLVCIFATLVKTTFLSLPLVIFLLILTYINRGKIKENKYRLKTIWQAFFLLIIPTILFSINKITALFNQYGSIGLKMLQKSFNSLGIGNGDTGTLDVSTNERVYNFKKLIFLLKNQPLEFLFGNGYKYFYIDIPILEVFIDFGIIGFIPFVLFFIMILFLSFKNILTSNNIFQLFLAFYIITTILTYFTQGRPMDYWFFIQSSLYIRFLGIKGSKDSLQ